MCVCVGVSVYVLMYLKQQEEQLSVNYFYE